MGTKMEKPVSFIFCCNHIRKPQQNGILGCEVRYANKKL